MILLRRKLVCERLRISRAASYRLIRGARLSLISSDELLEILNESRRGPQAVVTDIPSDIVTAEELVASEDYLRDSGITAANVLTWTERKRNPPPHYKINPHVRRFRRSTFKEWMLEGIRRRPR